MDLYLMQHGEAVEEAVDPARPLADAGRVAVGRVAERARAVGVRVDLTVHSGKLRAEQTALILAGAIGSVDAVRAQDGLAPNAPVGPTAYWLRGLEQDESVAIVGHLPFLGRLTGVLVAGEETTEVIRFRMGALVKLVARSDRTGFAVAWVLPPELA